MRDREKRRWNEVRAVSGFALVVIGFLSTFILIPVYPPLFILMSVAIVAFVVSNVYS